MASLLRKLVLEQRVTPVAHRLLASCRGYASRPPVPYAELVVGDPRQLVRCSVRVAQHV